MQKLSVNGERLKQTLQAFAEIGRTERGGVTRLALTEEDKRARDYFCQCCREWGMDVKVDDLGNIYATLAGTEEIPPIVVGSHLDTVKKGGRFDGVLGVVCGLEIARTLVEHDIKLRVPYTVVNFTNEEGARFEPSMMASGILSGKFDKEQMMAKRDAEQISFAEALKAIGYAGDEGERLKQASALIELHIEQGPVLEREGRSIGVVESVLGMVCYEIEVLGESNHAGTTPMNMRRDALFAANRILSEARRRLAPLDDRLVFTMGRFNVYPNVHTVIPNRVVFTIESRHKDPRVIRRVEEVIRGLGAAEPEGCEIRIRKLWDRKTVFFDEALVDRIEKVTKDLGYSYRRMDSGAGHDAQFMASYVPAAMVFVPSRKGKSHCEEEFTPYEDCEKGANVVLNTVLQLQREL